MLVAVVVAVGVVVGVAVAVADGCWFCACCGCVCVFVHVNMHGCVFWACVRVNGLLCGCTNVCVWEGNTSSNFLLFAVPP